jgi:hypothetical protein
MAGGEIMIILDDGYLWEPMPWGVGAAHGVSSDTDTDIIDDLHAVIFEVTGVQVEIKKRRIGFL